MNTQAKMKRNLDSGLNSVLQHSTIWRARSHNLHHQNQNKAQQATGFPELDQDLPEGGWPYAALTEILHDYPGQGEIALLLPTLAKITQKKQMVAFIDPPCSPYAPALASAGIDLNYLINISPPKPTHFASADRLWALEQALRSGHCQAVLAWPETHLSVPALRRLQLAAEAGQAHGFLFRHSQTRQQHSPAALRLQLLPGEGQIALDIIKCRGRYFKQPVTISNSALYSDSHTLSGNASSLGLEQPFK